MVWSKMYLEKRFLISQVMLGFMAEMKLVMICVRHLDFFEMSNWLPKSKEYFFHLSAKVVVCYVTQYFFRSLSDNHNDNAKKVEQHFTKLRCSSKCNLLIKALSLDYMNKQFKLYPILQSYLLFSLNKV